MIMNQHDGTLGFGRSRRACTSARSGKLAYPTLLAMVPGSAKGRSLFFIVGWELELRQSNFHQLKSLLLLLPSPPASCAASTIMSREKADVMMPPLSPPTPSLDALPRHIVTAFILPCITSSDWLNFRLASRTCYCLVHGSGAEDVSQFCCPTCRPLASLVGGDASNLSFDGTETNDGTTITPSSNNDVLSDNLWKLALMRDFQFEDVTNKEGRSLMYQSIHLPLQKHWHRNLFESSNLYMSWKHWQKLRNQIHLVDHRQVCVMLLLSAFGIVYSYLRRLSIVDSHYKWNVPSTLTGKTA